MKTTEKLPFNCVLLIDDDSTSLFLSELMIKRNRFSSHIHTISDCNEAISFLQEHCIDDIIHQMEACPDLIFLDINMPGMDGFDFLKAVRSNEKYNESKFKVFMLTSSDNKYDIEKANKLGVDGYINKPLTASKLLSIVQAA
jgi:CheY-like chemotaxis protein